MIQALPLPTIELREKVAAFLSWSEHGQWRALFGGRTNSAWEVRSGSNTAVLKLYRSQSANPLFPNDAAAEATLLQHLDTFDVAPRLVAKFQSLAGDCVLYDALPGDPWREDVEPVAALMKRLHHISPPENLRCAPDGSAALLAQADTILDKCQNRAALEAVRPNISVPPSGARNLLHCDMVPGNLISHAGDLKLIDWQCPAVGDPCEDIAVFLSPAMQSLYRGSALTEEDVTRFLTIYDEHADRYRTLAPAFHFRMAAYCQWQVENDGPDYKVGRDAEISALSAYL